LNIRYEIQFQPKGISDAFIIAERFIGKDQVCLILGDNLFHGKLDFLRNAIKTNEGGTIFGYEVNDPERYGVVEFDHEGNVLSIEEKPHTPKSNYAIPGLYIFDSDVVSIAKTIKPSARGELEITDVNKEYLNQGNLKVSILDRGTAWLDTGTFPSLMQAGQFVQVIEERQGLKIGAIEEAAYKMGFINAEELRTIAQPLLKSGYGTHLISILSQ
jgi:glucose-1-phosphate thymidylyltransferase